MQQGLEQVSDRGYGGEREIAGDKRGRVLMLCYFFPPINTAGTARNAGFFYALPAFGWDPTVLTVTEPKDSWSIMALDAKVPDDIQIVRRGEWDFTRVVDFLDGAYNRVLGAAGVRFRDVLCVPDPQLGWAPLRTARELAERHDCIYVSCSPFSSAIWGAWLKKKTGKSLVVDFRDPWSLNPYSIHGRWHRRISKLQERWVIETSNVVIVNTEGSRRLYCEHYPEMCEKFEYIPNGFDRLNPARPAPARRPLRIMHFGSFYGTRHPGLLLQAIRELPELPIEFVQVGPPDGLEGGDPRVKIIPTVSRRKAEMMMRRASLLYLKQGKPENEYRPVSVAAKTYEYLATGLPIFAECPEGDNADIIRRNADCNYIVSDGKVSSIKDALRDAYRVCRNRQPEVNPKYANDFSRESLTGKLADVLGRVS